MEFILVLLLVILLFATLSNRPKNELKNLFNIIEALGKEIRSLRKEIGSLEAKIEDLKPSPQQGHDSYYSTMKTVPEPEPASVPEEKPAPEIVIESKTVVPEEINEVKETFNSVPQQKTPDPIEPAIPQEKEKALFTDDYLSSGQPAASISEPKYRKETIPEPAKQESWISKNPDLEKFIGENLINKIGIAILVLGIAFFVKYAIDQNWINEAGRVAIGIGCGAILVGIAHYMRNSYRSFSSVLAGGGIAVFYFTIAFAYHQYHLMSQTAAFVIMVIITVFAVTLSILYDKLELAVIATIGGFLAPFLVSNGEGNYVALFTYLAILNVGLVSLSWFKRWPLVNIIALFFTIIIYGSWLGYALADNKPYSTPIALTFASIFYLIFILMNMLHQLRNKQKFKAFDFFLLVLISFWYYAVGMVLMHHWNNGAYQGLFTLSAGFINLALAWIVYKSSNADRNLLYLLIGLTATFVTLTIPIQLHGHAITMFWSAEFVLLYWLYSYSGIKPFKQSSLLLCVLTLGSLLIDWNNNDFIRSDLGILCIFKDLTGIITNILAVISFGLYSILLWRNNDTLFLSGISNKKVGNTMLIISISILYVTCFFGVNLHFSQATVYDLPNIYHRAITEIFALALIILMQRNIIKTNALLQFVLLIACFLFYAISNNYITNMREGVLSGHFHYFHIYFHWLDSLIMVALFYKTISGIRKNMAAYDGAITGISVAICFMILAFLSVEVQQLYIFIGYRKNNLAELNWQYGKAGLSALWGICSFALMWLGMKHREKTLRIISLTIFSIVLLKLFIFDISGISEGGKIFAFILLGVLLLTVSFMYQKLKKIIIDDNKKE